MRLLSVVAALSSLALFASAQNFSSYVPECAPPCVKQAISDTKSCTGLDDNVCLCSKISELIPAARPCFIATCNATNLGQLRSTITSGWERFCNDSGTPADLDEGPIFGGFPGSPGPTSTTASSVTPSIQPTSSTTASSDTVSTNPSDLTTGAKVGIGVGVGLGSLLVIGAFVFLGYRLGQQKKRGNVNEVENNEEGQPKDGQSAAMATTIDGGDPWAYKTADGTAELFSPHAELPGHDVVRELPANDRPVELWHGVMPPELSADSEIPRDRAPRL